MDILKKLRDVKLRPTKQRILLANLILDGKNKHFTAETIQKEVLIKGHNISLATIYNTVHAFLGKGYLKQIAVNSEQSYYDTNTSDHHHFYDEDKNQLIDIHDSEVEPVKINKKIPGKRIKSIEVLVKVQNN